MKSCRQCRREIPLETALLSQDFYAKPAVFCSVTCQGLWINQICATFLTGQAALFPSERILATQISDS
jgi:hypothetical protein